MIPVVSASLISQSQPWGAARWAQAFSCKAEPVRRTAGKPVHRSPAAWAGVFGVRVMELGKASVQCGVLGRARHDTVMPVAVATARTSTAAVITPRRRHNALAAGWSRRSSRWTSTGSPTFRLDR